MFLRFRLMVLPEEELVMCRYGILLGQHRGSSVMVMKAIMEATSAQQIAIIMTTKRTSIATLHSTSGKINVKVPIQDKGMDIDG